MNHKLESKALLELVKSFDDYIEIPKSIAHNDISKYKTSIENIVKSIKQYNDYSNDTKESVKNLRSLTTILLRVTEEILEDITKTKYQHHLVIKKKDYVIKGLKSFISSKEELDAEIPSDDEDDEPTSATSGLSDKEKKILGIK